MAIMSLCRRVGLQPSKLRRISRIIASSSRQQTPAAVRLPAAKNSVISISDTVTSQQFRRMVQVRFYGQDAFHYLANRPSSTPKNGLWVPKVMHANPTKVAYSGVRL